MKIFIRNAVVTIAAALTVASCAGSPDLNKPDDVGFLSAPVGWGSEIMITPETKSVNVVQYEIVKFINAATGKSFVWNFSVRSWGKFDLSAVAPPGVIPPGQQVVVHISEFLKLNPM